MLSKFVLDEEINSKTQDGPQPFPLWIIWHSRPLGTRPLLNAPTLSTYPHPIPCELSICFLNMSFNALGPLLTLFPLSEVPFPSVQTSRPTFWTLTLSMQPSSSRVKLIPVIPTCLVLIWSSLTASRPSSGEPLLLHSQSIQTGWSWRTHIVF